VATGGSVEEGLSLAADIAALGMPSLALKYLYTKSIFERGMVERLAEKVSDSRKILDHNLAVEIANEVGKLFK
jgi:hypothetical protein